VNKNRDTILFYDGDCGLCQKVVQFVLKNERRNCAIYFTSLQSDFTKDFFLNRGLPQPDLTTFYLFRENKIYSKSTAVLKLLPFLKPIFLLFNIGCLFPEFLRDAMYDFIAKRRNRIKNSTCLIPSAKNNHRFIK
jgi:predicted DCC family thiol-disulfide oxidoreductase YuxK